MRSKHVEEIVYLSVFSAAIAEIKIIIIARRGFYRRGQRGSPRKRRAARSRDQAENCHLSRKERASVGRGRSRHIIVSSPNDSREHVLRSGQQLLFSIRSFVRPTSCNGTLLIAESLLAAICIPAQLNTSDLRGKEGSLLEAEICISSTAAGVFRSLARTDGRMGDH